MSADKKNETTSSGKKSATPTKKNLSSQAKKVASPNKKVMASDKKNSASVKKAVSAEKKVTTSVKTTTSSKTKGGSVSKKGRGNSQKYSGMPKSATVLAVERQKKIEKISPLGQITAELPVLGRALDAPVKGPRLKIRMPQLSEMDFEFNPRKHMRLWIALGILILLLFAGLFVISKYTVDTVIVEGNVHYTNDEIYNFVIGDKKIGTNSIYLSMKYKNKEIVDIPFIQTMSVKIVDSKTIKITVYEKALAGYIEYLDRYFYFDKDGTVIESTNIKTTGIPQVLGLDFDHVVMYEKLPLENEEIFGQILEMTQLLTKYEIEMDKIYFDKKYNMTLYFGDARIRVGNFDYIDEKIIKLKSILPELEGKSGVLRLDNYKGADDIVTFEMDS